MKMPLLYMSGKSTMKKCYITLPFILFPLHLSSESCYWIWEVTQHLGAMDGCLRCTCREARVARQTDVTVLETTGCRTRSVLVPISAGQTFKLASENVDGALEDRDCLEGWPVVSF